MERVDYESMVIRDLLNAHERNEINVAPWYQRRAVWTDAHKSYLINSIFEKMPVPSIYIRHTLDIDGEKTIKEVVDGQQRVRSIIEYKANRFAARHPDHEKKIRYEELSSTERRNFLMAKLPIAYLIEANDVDVIEIFGRLNAVSKTLNAQEQRTARYSGEFHQFCLRQAAERLPLWRGLNIFGGAAISRMAEVQFTAELCMALVNGMEDFSAKRVDAAYREWDEDFPHRASVDRRLERVFRVISTLRPEAIKDTIFSRSPVFYSLVLVLDSLKRIPSRDTLAHALADIDTRFNDPRPINERPKEDVEFVAACKASTQRIKSREIRFEYIAASL